MFSRKFFHFITAIKFHTVALLLGYSFLALCVLCSAAVMSSPAHAVTIGNQPAKIVWMFYSPPPQLATQELPSQQVGCEAWMAYVNSHPTLYYPVLNPRATWNLTYGYGCIYDIVYPTYTMPNVFYQWEVVPVSRCPDGYTLGAHSTAASAAPPPWATSEVSLSHSTAA